MWTCDLCSYDSCDFEVDCVICQRCAHAQPYPEPNAESSGDDADKSTELGSGELKKRQVSRNKKTRALKGVAKNPPKSNTPNSEKRQEKIVGEYITEKSNRSRTANRHMDALYDKAKQLQSECGYGVALIVVAPKPTCGPRAHGLSLVLTDKNGDRPSMATIENEIKRKQPMFDMGTETTEDMDGKKITPTKKRVREERELLSDNFISPFGASFASTIENQQIESINIRVDEEERSDITPVDITPVAKNRLSTPGNQSILSSGPNSSPGNVISRLSNLSSVQPKTKPVFFARKSAPIVPPRMATQSMYVTPAPVPELSGHDQNQPGAPVLGVPLRPLPPVVRREVAFNPLLPIHIAGLSKPELKQNLKTFPPVTCMVCSIERKSHADPAYRRDDQNRNKGVGKIGFRWVACKDTRCCLWAHSSCLFQAGLIKEEVKTKKNFEDLIFICNEHKN